MIVLAIFLLSACELHGQKVPWHSLHEIMTKYGLEAMNMYHTDWFWSLLSHPQSPSLLAMSRAHTTHWNWLKKHACVPNLPVLVRIQMLACCFMSPLITSELLFLLSSQGGYTMAYCQKEISWWKAHNWSIILRELQSQLHISSFQYCGLMGPPWLKYQRVELIAAAGFPGAALGSEDTGRGQVQHPAPSLMWPSRKEVYKGEHPEQQTFFSWELNSSEC